MQPAVGKLAVTFEVPYLVCIIGLDLHNVMSHAEVVVQHQPPS